MILQQQITFLFIALRINTIICHICIKENTHLQCPKRKDSPRRFYMYFLKSKLGLFIEGLISFDCLCNHIDCYSIY